MEKKSLNTCILLPGTIFLASFILGISYIIQIESTDAFFYNFHKSTDMLTFYNRALAVYQGSGWLFPLRMPLYANFFLPLLFNIFGPNVLLVRMVQILFAAASNVLIFHIGRKSFNQTTGIIAAVIAVFYSRFLIYAGVLLSETLAVFLLLTLILLLYKFRQNYSYWLLSSIIIIWSLLILIRPKFLIVSVFLIPWLVFTLPRDRRRLATMLCMILLGITIIVGPRSLKNIFFESGTSLLSSNIEYARRLLAADSQVQEEDLAIFKNAKQDVTKSAPGHVYIRAVKFILVKPIKFLRFFKAKFLLFFSPGESVYDNFPPGYYRNICPLLKLTPFGWGIILPLGFFGLVVGFTKIQDKRLLYILLLGYILSVFLFQIADRYRLMSEPFFIIFAAFGLYFLAKKLVKDRVLGLRLVGLVLIAELMFNFKAIDRKLYILSHPHGLCLKTQNALVITDTPVQFSNLKYKAMLQNSSQYIIKHLFIDEHVGMIKEAYLLIDGYYLERFEMQFAINEAQGLNRWQSPDRDYPFLGTLKLPLAANQLKRGLNTIKISTRTPNTFYIFIDTRYDYNRSAFSKTQEDIDYNDLGSSSLLGDGEYRIAIELKK